jgi:DNA processing protein
MEHTRFYLGFNLINGIGPARLSQLVELCGSVAQAWQATPAQLARAGIDAKLAAAFFEQRSRLDLDAELARVARLGLRLITREDGNYPLALSAIPAPPPLLYVRGTLDPADAWAVAVVGTRRMSFYGREATRRLAGDLARAGVTVVSGLALGVDTLAHRATLEAGGRTIAVLGCGLDSVYPERNRELARQISRSGALVSEFALGTRPTPQLFPVRNRLISGLARGVLVIEAAEQSGALITVQYALEQGRDVFAVPGSIFSPTSSGTNRLIREGAGLIAQADDLLEALQMRRLDARREARAELPADATEAALLGHLGHEPLHVDALCRALDLPLPAVSAALALLELKGSVRQVGPMLFVLR